MARIASTPGAGTENLVVGKVLILYGTVKAIAEDGTVRLLGPNSPIYANEHVITESDGSVSIQFAGPPVTQLDLGRMTEIVIDEDVYAGVVPEAVSDAAAQAEQIQEALLEGDQPIELEATAAGGGTGAGGGHPTVVFDLTGNEVTPGSGAETTGVNFSTVDTLHGVFDESGGGTPYAYPGVVTLTASETITEAPGQLITYTATVDNPPHDSNLVLTLDNNLTITIPAGETTGSVTATFGGNEDVYVDSGVIPVSIVGATGGNYTSLDASDTASTAVVDTIDTTLVSLTASPALMTEDGATITYTVTLTNEVRVGDDPVTVTFNDLLGAEHTITITGGTTGSVDVTVAESVFEDVYAEDPTGLGKLTAEDISVTGGNYENLMIGAVNTQVTLSDSIDTTTVSLAASPALMTEDGATITYTATLTNAVRVGDDPITVTFNDLLGTEHTITISGGTTGSEVVNVAESVFEDAYAEDPTGLGRLTAEDISVAGGNYENLMIGAVNTQVTLSDSIDTTTVSLAASPALMTEDGATITYTATLTNAVRAGDDPITVTFNDLLGTEHTITISSGTTGAEVVNVAEVVFEDVYAENPAGLGKLTPEDISVAGGNYENLMIGSVNTQVTLSDTIDTVTVGIVANGDEGEGVTVTEAASASFTVSVSQTLDHD
ncbi:MAG: retention module-containing protein, partial [Deltaproteobacteria bacterium]|nr:retention module-containing protein [Deltaproteobacteria bacterium]